LCAKGVEFDDVKRLEDTTAHEALEDTLH
jgi:hypothetical protein